MSRSPRVCSINIASQPDSRPVLCPTGNKVRSISAQKTATKSQRKIEKLHEVEAAEKKLTAPSAFLNLSAPRLAPSISKQQDQHHGLSVLSNLSMSASCSSDASSDSFTSTGRRSRRNATPVRRKKTEKVQRVEKVLASKNSVVEGLSDETQGKKRCAWVTPNTDPHYAAFHDEEWGVPVHNDKKLFELLSLSGALAELSWPSILNKRHIFREVFLDFDPAAVSKLNEKKLVTLGCTARSLLSELKLRSIVDNARQICKIINEFGSFDKYMWNYVNYKPIVSQFRYARQVPAKTSKAEVISKDLIRRGFRGVGPTVIYTFMQVSGITNDHLTSCFRFRECVAVGEVGEKDGLKVAKIEDQRDGECSRDLVSERTEETATDLELPEAEDIIDLGLSERALDDLKLSL